MLLPTPGTPVMPMRNELPEWGRHPSMMSCAIAKWSGLELSIIVMAWLKMVRSPVRMPWMYSSRDNFRRLRTTGLGLTLEGCSTPSRSVSADLKNLSIYFIIYFPKLKSTASCMEEK